jgi:hypothetical protein
VDAARGRRWVSLLVGLVLIVGGMAFAIVRLVPCAFATSEAPAEDIVVPVERWLEIVPPFPAPSSTTIQVSDRTTSLEAVVRVVRHGHPKGEPIEQRIVIDRVFLEDIPEEISRGSAVFLGFVSEGLVREEVWVAIARDADGRHTFLGGCYADEDAGWLREMLGSRYDMAIRRIIGVTDPDAIYGVLAGVRAAPGHVLLEYEERPPDLRLFERTGTLVERGACLAIETEVGPLVPIWDARHFLALDDEGLVVMEGLGRGPRPGDRLVLSGREMSPTEALAVTDRASLRRCPGRLILLGRASRTTA